jgi:hypothetical protein
MRKIRVVAGVLIAAVILTNCRDTSSPETRIATVDGFLARVCQLAGQCPGISATQTEVQACPGRIRAQLSQNQLTALERFTTYTEVRQACILDCMRTSICTRFGGSIDNISDSDVVDPFRSCEQSCQ